MPWWPSFGSERITECLRGRHWPSLQASGIDKAVANYHCVDLPLSASIPIREIECVSTARISSIFRSSVSETFVSAGHDHTRMVAFGRKFGLPPSWMNGTFHFRGFAVRNSRIAQYL